MLRGLTVLHRRKGLGSPSPGALAPVPTASGPTLILDTCQRWICVSQGHVTHAAPTGVDRFEGEEAYRFLLRVTTGLESRLQGETNIFGQVKLAWAPYGHHFPWLQRLFEDTKEIRAQHLSDVGGPSYGRLVRRLLHSIATPQGRPLLLVGAGELARAIAPWLTGFELRILNRNRSRADALVQSLLDHGHGRHSIRAIDAAHADAVDAAWRDAHGIVLCIPFDAPQDAARIRLLQSRAAQPSSPSPQVLHLGGTHAQAGAWTDVPGFRSLDDVFLLHQQESGARNAQIRRADRACRERARLRTLGPSLSISHGWEDLASFVGWDAESIESTDRRREDAYSRAVDAEPALA